MLVYLRSWCVFSSDLSVDDQYAKQNPTQGLEKRIPGTPDNETPVHLRKRQIFSHNISSIRDVASSEDRAK